MKSFFKDEVCTIALALILALQIVSLIFTRAAYHAVSDNDIRYESMVKFGDIDENATLFMDNDGDLFVYDARFVEESGSEFILVMNGHNTKTKSDDTIEDIMVHPVLVPSN